MEAIGLTQCAKYYRSKDFKTEHKKVSREIYRNFVTDFLKFIKNKILEGDKVTLPEKCGTLYIKPSKIILTIDDKGKVKGHKVDWKKTKELWERKPEAKAQKKLVYFTCENTSGILYKLFWSLKNVYHPYKLLYHFSGVRSLKRSMAEVINNGKEY